jgi:non-ribosomal peptide synthetase-like protein
MFQNVEAGPSAMARTAPAPSALPQHLAIEGALADVLAGVMGLGQVPVDSDFFDELGADSLKMAHFCARVRKRSDLPNVSMKDVYRHSTIRALATALADDAPGSAGESVPSVVVRTPTPARSRQVALCGLMQLLIFVGYAYLSGLVLAGLYEFLAAASGVTDVYLRSVVCSSGLFVFFLTVPIATKWILIGRWKRQEIPLWSVAYVRFWLVRTLVQRNLLVFLFAGSPLYSFYLRALGAKVGRGASIFTLSVPVCTDLLTIGAGTVIGKDSFLNGYRAQGGVIQTGAVTLGSDVFVGEVTVLDIDTSMGDGAQLGHGSTLHAGQSVPAGASWHGSPAQPTEVNYRRIGTALTGDAVRRATYSVIQLLNAMLLFAPLAVGGTMLLLIELPLLSAVLDPGTVDLTDPGTYGNALVASAVLFFGSLVIGLLVVATVPRVLNLALEPDRVYPLYGLHYAVHRAVTRFTNLKTYTFLFGDSSYIVHYLKWIGYDLGEVRQTGSNFGQAVKHDNPYLSSVGSGTVVADGLSIMNAEFSSTSFRLSHTSIGANNFLGNRIAYPSGGRTGDNCLLGTKVMIPIDGKVRENVGLLGSPPFEIPRTVDRDSGLGVGADELRPRLAAKNGHNVATIAVYLLVRYFFVLVMILLGSLAASLYSEVGALAIALMNVLVLLVSVVYFVLLERFVGHLQLLRPDGCSIYDLAFWRHERYWKVSSVAFVAAFSGTPFKGLIWRAMGARVGRRVFDDGCMLVERRFATIGDDCTLNAGSIIQTHSQEDGAFKSDHSSVGAGCTLGVGAFVHYGVTIGAGAVLAADSFLMKGEDMPAQAYWGGNPAKELREPVRIPTTGDDSPVHDAAADVRPVGARP